MSALHQRMPGGGGEVDSRPRRQLSPSSSQHRLNSSSSSQPSNLQNKDDQDSTRRLYAAVAASVPSASSSPRSARHASERTPQLVGFTSRNDQGSSSRQGTPRQQLSASSSRPPAAAQQYGRSSSSSNSDSSSDSSRSSFTESDNDDDEEIETLITVSQKTGKSIGLIRELNPSLQDVRDHDPLEPGLQLVLTRRRTAPTLLRPPAAATEEDDRPLRKAVSEMPPRESRYPPEQRTETRVVDASPRSGQPAPTATVGSPSGSVGRDAAPVTLRRLGSKLRVPIADLQKGALADCGPDDPISYGLLQQEQYQGKSLASWLVGDPSAALPPVAATQTHQSSSSPSVHRSTAAAAPPPSAPAPNSGGRALPPSSLSPAPPATITPTGMHIPPLPLSSMAAVSATHRSCPPPPPPPGMSSSSSNVPYRPLPSDRAVAVLSNASTPRNGSRCVTPNKLLSPRHPRASSPERDGGGPFGESFTSIPTLHDGPDGMRQRELDRSESNVLRNRRAGHKVFAVPYWHCRSSNNRDNKISSRHAGAQPSNRKESSSSSCSPSLSEKRQWTLKLVARDVAGLSVNDLLNLNPEMETLFRLDEALPAGTAIVVPPNAQILHWEGEDEPPQQQQQQNETPLLLLGRQSRSSSAASQTNNNLNGSTSNTQKHSMSRGSSAAASSGDGGGGGGDYADCSPGPTKRRPLLSDRPSSSGSRPSANQPPSGRLFPNTSSRNINHTPLRPAATSGGGGGALSGGTSTTNSHVEAVTVEPIQPSSRVGMTMKEISVSVGISEAELYALNVHLQHAAPDDMLASNAMIYVPVSQRQRKHHHPQDPTAEQRSKSPSMSLATATHYSGGSAAQPQLALPPRAAYQRLTPRSKSEMTTTVTASVAAQLPPPHDASSSVPHHKSVSEAAQSQRDVSLPQTGDADAGGFEDVSPVRHTRLGGARSVLESQASHAQNGMASKERTEGSYSVSQSSAPPLQHPNEFSSGKLHQQQPPSLPAVSVSSGGAPSGTLVIGRFAITKPHLTVQSIADRLGIAADWIYDLNIAELVDRPGGVYHSKEPLPLGLVLSLPKL